VECMVRHEPWIPRQRLAWFKFAAQGIVFSAMPENERNRERGNEERKVMVIRIGLEEN